MAETQWEAVIFPSILLTAPSPALGKAQWKAISFQKTMHPPLDLWYYPQGKHAPIYQPLTQGTGRRWCSCVIPFKLMDGWRCSVLKQPPFTMGTQGYQTKDAGSQTSVPLISDPSRPHLVALPGNSGNVSWKKLDPSLVIPRRGLLLLYHLVSNLAVCESPGSFSKILMPKSRLERIW